MKEKMCVEGEERNMVSLDRWVRKKGVKSLPVIDRERKARIEREGGKEGRGSAAVLRCLSLRAQPGDSFYVSQPCHLDTKTSAKIW